MTIRPYMPFDKSGCLEAFRSNTPEYFAERELDEFDSWLSAYANTYSANAPHNTEQYFVVERDDKIAACGGFHLDPDQLKATMVWGLVHRDLHKNGIGRNLFLYRADLITQVCPACCIVLDTSQNTCPFFEKLGFSVTKVTNDFYGSGLHRYDMERRSNSKTSI